MPVARSAFEMAMNVNLCFKKGKTNERTTTSSSECAQSKFVFHFVIPAVLIVAVATTCCHASCGTRPLIQWRPDGRCGRGFPAIASSLPAKCNPHSDRPCCSDYGYCGNSPSHCHCSACIDFRRNLSITSTSAPRLVLSSNAYHYFFKYISPSIQYYIVTEPVCHFALEKESGYWTSPEFPKPYPIGRDCCYDIHRPNEDFCGVSLLVESLDVGRGEEEGYCQRDWLSLPSCVPERGTRICGNETGQYFQYLFQPGASAIRFEFHSGNRSEDRTGFKIKYELLRRCLGPFQTQSPPITHIPGTKNAPCYTRITDPRGTINTPYYPKIYPADMDCVYEFVRTNAKMCGIQMQSIRFAVEDPFSTPFGGACTDFFHLPSCGFLCGKVNFSWLVHFQPGATSIKFHFHSDKNETVPQRPGFQINFEQVTDC